MLFHSNQLFLLIIMISQQASFLHHLLEYKECWTAHAYKPGKGKTWQSNIHYSSNTDRAGPEGTRNRFRKTHNLLHICHNRYIIFHLLYIQNKDLRYMFFLLLQLDKVDFPLPYHGILLQVPNTRCINHNNRTLSTNEHISPQIKAAHNWSNIFRIGYRHVDPVAKPFLQRKSF